MSTHAKQVIPNRCYCRVQDEGVSLNEIAKLINTLNQKILDLRNEVSTLNNVNPDIPDGKRKLLEKSQPVSYNREIDDLQKNVRYNKCMISENSKVLTNIFQNDSTNKKSISKNIKDANSSESKLKVQTKRNPVIEIKPRRRIKKISHGVQCNLAMDRRGKRIFLNCFKTDYNFLKPNKKMKLSSESDIHIGYDKEKFILTNIKQEDEQNLQLEVYASEEEPSREDVDRLCKLIKMEPEKDKFQEDECQLFKCPTNRMGGGAEIRGNHLISDFHDKIQKINLYRNVKFDAKNVKRRLDACINELNEIIEDVSLIFSK